MISMDGDFNTPEFPKANLDGFVTSSRSQRKPVATSQEIRDRGSTFVSYIYSASTPDEAKDCINYVKNVVHGTKKASHEIAAWRCMVLRRGKTGLGGPDDFELKTGSMDDGENWAGGKVLKVMQNQAVIDAVVIVSRWYGGTLLGPARFAHIETCAIEVCRDFRRSEDFKDAISTLSTLDDILADLRSEYARLLHTTASSSQSPSTSVEQKRGKRTDYSALELSKAKRLIQARENSIKTVKGLLAQGNYQTLGEKGKENPRSE